MPRFLNNNKFSIVISDLLSKLAAPFTYQLESDLKDHYINVINDNPKDSDAYNNLGVLNYEFGNYKQSLKDLSKAISINTQYHHHIHYFCSAVYTYLGHTYFHEKILEKATENYEKAIFQDHQNKEASYYLSETSQKISAQKKKKGSGNFDYFRNIILDFDYSQISNLRYKNLLNILTKDNKKLETIIYKIDFLYQKKHYKEVLKFSKEALKKYNHKQFLYYMAACSYHLGYLNQAQKFFEKFLQTDPDNSQAIYDYSFCLISNKNYKKARALLQKPLKTNPDNEFTKFSLGLTYFFEEKHKKAQEFFIDSLDLSLKKHDSYHENSSNQFFNRAYVYFLNTQYDLAITDLTKSLDLNSSNEESLHLRAKIYFIRKRYHEAKSDVDSLLLLNADHAESILMHDKIIKELEANS